MNNQFMNKILFQRGGDTTLGVLVYKMTGIRNAVANIYF